MRPSWTHTESAPCSVIKAWWPCAYIWRSANIRCPNRCLWRTAWSYSLGHVGWSIWGGRWTYALLPLSRRLSIRRVVSSYSHGKNSSPLYLFWSSLVEVISFLFRPSRWVFIVTGPRKSFCLIGLNCADGRFWGKLQIGSECLAAIWTWVRTAAVMRLQVFAANRRLKSTPMTGFQSPPGWTCHLHFGCKPDFQLKKCFLSVGIAFKGSGFPWSSKWSSYLRMLLFSRLQAQTSSSQLICPCSTWAWCWKSDSNWTLLSFITCMNFQTPWLEGSPNIFAHFCWSA